ncbi:MAG: ATP-dependent helicase, partial [Endozoicomonas sp.]
YLNAQFEKRSIKELRGNYKGPKKLKSSGKAAGKKKKPTGKKSAAGKEETGKQRHRTRKTIGKRRKPSTNKGPSERKVPETVSVDAGFEPPKRKKQPQLQKG